MVSQHQNYEWDHNIVLTKCSIWGTVLLSSLTILSFLTILLLRQSIMIRWLVTKEMKDPLDLQDQKVNVACLVSGTWKPESFSRSCPLKGPVAGGVLSTHQPASAFTRVFPNYSHQIAEFKYILRLWFMAIFPFKNNEAGTLVCEDNWAEHLSSLTSCLITLVVSCISTLFVYAVNRPSGL